MNLIPAWVIRLVVLLGVLNIILFMPKDILTFLMLLVGGWQLGTWSSDWGNYVHKRLSGDDYEDYKQGK